MRPSASWTETSVAPWTTCRLVRIQPLLSKIVPEPTPVVWKPRPPKPPLPVAVVVMVTTAGLSLAAAVTMCASGSPAGVLAEA